VPTLHAATLVAIAAGALDTAAAWVRRATRVPSTPARALLLARLHAELSFAEGADAERMRACWHELARASHSWVARAQAIELVARAGPEVLPASDVGPWVAAVWSEVSRGWQRVALSWVLTGLGLGGSYLRQSVRVFAWSTAGRWSVLPSVGRWSPSGSADWLAEKVNAIGDPLPAALLEAGRAPSGRALHAAAGIADDLGDAVLAAGLRRRATWEADDHGSWAQGMRALRAGDRRGAEAALRAALGPWGVRPEAAMIALELAGIAADPEKQTLWLSAERIALAHGMALPDAEHPLG
jgi:hypothetical protein